jgi:hypothetical protein
MCNLYKSNYPLTPDGHHKLIRWRLVTHCAIDGYSRMVVYGGICTVVLDSVPEYYGIEEHGVAVNDREGIEIPSSRVILSDAQLHQL